MAKFPIDAPLERVLAAMAQLGFHVVRSGNHVALSRQNDDGTQTPMTMSQSPPTQAIDVAAILAAACIQGHR